MNEVEALTWERLLHKNGKFAAEVNWEHGLIRFVDRGGTVEYNFAERMAKAVSALSHPRGAADGGAEQAMKRRVNNGVVVAGAMAVSE